MICFLMSNNDANFLLDLRWTEVFKIKFRIVFSERIDSGNARVVFIFPNCSKDRVRYTKIFFVYGIVFRNINGSVMVLIRNIS